MNKGSEQFIKWAKKKLKEDNGYTYHELFRKAQARIFEYEKKNPGEVTKILVAKLSKAADEYGSPLDNKGKYNIEKELEMEVMDLVLGWPLISLYLEEN